MQLRQQNEYLRQCNEQLLQRLISNKIRIPELSLPEAGVYIPESISVLGFDDSLEDFESFKEEEFCNVSQDEPDAKRTLKRLLTSSNKDLEDINANIHRVIQLMVPAEPSVNYPDYHVDKVVNPHDSELEIFDDGYRTPGNLPESDDGGIKVLPQDGQVAPKGGGMFDLSEVYNKLLNKPPPAAQGTPYPSIDQDEPAPQDEPLVVGSPRPNRTEHFTSFHQHRTYITDPTMPAQVDTLTLVSPTARETCPMCEFVFDPDQSELSRTYHTQGHFKD